MSGRQLRVEYSPSVGKKRQMLFSAAFKRIDRAISSGFYLEAIVILESLICDRLESAISVKLDSEVSLGTLGPLITKSRGLNLFSGDLIDQIDRWRIERNQVMHQMVKISAVDSGDWRQRMKFARNTALEGRALLKSLMKSVDQLKRNLLKARKDS